MLRYIVALYKALIPLWTSSHTGLPYSAAILIVIFILSPLALGHPGVTLQGLNPSSWAYSSNLGLLKGGPMSDFNPTGTPDTFLIMRIVAFSSTGYLAYWQWNTRARSRFASGPQKSILTLFHGPPRSAVIFDSSWWFSVWLLGNKINTGGCEFFIVIVHVQKPQMCPQQPLCSYLSLMSPMSYLQHPSSKSVRNYNLFCSLLITTPSTTVSLANKCLSIHLLLTVCNSWAPVELGLHWTGALLYLFFGDSFLHVAWHHIINSHSI